VLQSLEDTRQLLINSSVFHLDSGVGVGGGLLGGGKARHARLAVVRDKAAAGLAELQQRLADLPVALGIIPNGTGA
jgi:hypothetical protein